MGITMDLSDQKTVVYLYKICHYLLSAGFVLFIIAYLHFMTHTKSNYLLIGNGVECLGYALLAIGYWFKGFFSILGLQTHVIIGHIVLAMYLTVSHILPINEYSTPIDIVGIFGNLFLVKETPLFILGLLFMPIFYIVKMCIFASTQNIYTILLILGSILITIGYIINIYIVAMKFNIITFTPMNIYTLEH